MDTTEYIDPENTIKTKALGLSRLLVASKRAICFTGAGISTSSGIPDYRSGFNTILATGPGAWESEENKNKHTKEKIKVEMRKAVPSKTHMAIYELISRDILHSIITQNVDGLHRKSGIPEHKLTELHGGTNKEICKDCHKEYLRDFRCRNVSNPEADHRTLRNCLDCNTPLHDTIVFFNQPLRVIDQTRAAQEVEAADFCLVLGSSLKVAPASRYPAKFVDNPGKKLAIVNLQKTHLDRKCDLRIGGLCDYTMELVMDKLGIAIPAYKVKRWFSFKVVHGEEESVLKIRNYNKEMLDFSVFQSVKIELNTGRQQETVEMDAEPFEYRFRGKLQDLHCQLRFFGHQEEKDLEIGGEDWGPVWESLEMGREVVVAAEYCLSEKSWDLLEARVF